MFWAEAANTASYLLNRSPSAAVGFKTPMELWSGNLEGYEKLRIFGCAAFAHMKQRKLDARALRCILMGFPEGVKGYRLWCLEPEMKKIVISRDVTFIEHEFPWKCSQSGIESNQQVVEVTVDHPEAQRVIHSEGEESEVVTQEVATQGHSEDDTEVQNNDYILVRDRERRIPKRTVRYGFDDVVASAMSAAESLEDPEPQSYSEAINSEDADLWMKAMEEEMSSLHKKPDLGNSG